MHLYPIKNDYLERAIEVADLATANGKKFVIGECWLYKIDNANLAKTGQAATQAEIFARDNFSFWQPLDERFIALIVKLANYKHCEFISCYWSKYFFAYLDYDGSTRDLPYRSLATASNQAAVKNMLAAKLSGTGMKYQELIGQK